MLESSTENDLVAGVRSGLDYTGSISQLVTSPILPQQPYSHTDGTICDYLDCIKIFYISLYVNAEICIQVKIGKEV